MTQLLAAGEHDIAVETNLNSVLSLSKQGAPLGFAPIQPFFLSPSLVFMSANAPHPFAGALFTDYLLSEEGQKIIVTTNRMPAHIESEIAGEPTSRKARTCACRIFSI